MFKKIGWCVQKIIIGYEIYIFIKKMVKEPECCLNQNKYWIKYTEMIEVAVCKNHSLNKQVS